MTLEQVRKEVREILALHAGDVHSFGDVSVALADPELRAIHVALRLDALARKLDLAQPVTGPVSDLRFASRP